MGEVGEFIKDASLYASISAEKPAGEESSLLMDEFLLQLQSYDEEDSYMPQGVWQKAVQKVNWQDLLQKLLDIWKTRSKDVRLFTAFAWVLKNLYHMQGITLLLQFIEANARLAIMHPLKDQNQWLEWFFAKQLPKIMGQINLVPGNRHDSIFLHSYLGLNQHATMERSNLLLSSLEQYEIPVLVTNIQQFVSVYEANTYKPKTLQIYVDILKRILETLEQQINPTKAAHALESNEAAAQQNSHEAKSIAMAAASLAEVWQGYKEHHKNSAAVMFLKLAVLAEEKSFEELIEILHTHNVDILNLVKITKEN